MNSLKPIVNLLAVQRANQQCDIGGINFLGIEGWYKYVPTHNVGAGIGCQLDFGLFSIGTFWLVLAGLLDILLRIGTFVAVFYFIWGGLKMITSQGSPEGIKNARTTMTNALVGLVICVVATQVLSFFMGKVLGVNF